MTSLLLATVYRLSKIEHPALVITRQLFNRRCGAPLRCANHSLLLMWNLHIHAVSVSVRLADVHSGIIVASSIHSPVSRAVRDQTM